MSQRKSPERPPEANRLEHIPDLVLSRLLVMPPDADTPFTYRVKVNAVMPSFTAVFGTSFDWGSRSLGAEHLSLSILHMLLPPTENERVLIRGHVFRASLRTAELAWPFLLDVIQHCPYWYAHLPIRQVRNWIASADAAGVEEILSDQVEGGGS